jgi:hypothetical protein
MASKFSKYFFEQHGKDIAKENTDFEAYHESTKLEMPQCNHSQIRFENGELRCLCGVGYQGSKEVLLEVYNQLHNISA